MKKILLSLTLCLGVTYTYAQINSGKIGALTKGVKAFTVSDDELKSYTKEAVVWMDENNPVCQLNDKDKTKRAYAERLEKIVAPIKGYDGIDINYKVYWVSDINAFATYDGSVRVFAGLMDLMTDDEILGVIGHEIGHVKLGHTKKAYKQALITSALADYAGSTNGSLASLSNSQIGEIATQLTSAQFSQGQESGSDDYAYKFMVDLGKDPAALASAFTKLGSLSGGKASTAQKLMSSHPDSAKRAKKVEEKIAKDAKKK